MKFELSLDLEVNVTIRLLDEHGNVLDEEQGHNITINVGRHFLRDLLCAASYPGVSINPPAVVPGCYYEGSHLPGRPTDEGYIVPRTDHRVRFIAVGTGGSQQVYSYPGVGTQAEIASVMGLERPIPVAFSAQGFTDPLQPGASWRWQWAKQVEPQAVEGSIQLPKYFNAVYRAVFGKNDLSFSGQVGDYGTLVPVSEVMLLTSEFHPYVRPPYAGTRYDVLKLDGSVCPKMTQQEAAGYPQGVPGGLAYNLHRPFPKTPRNLLEILWHLRS